MAARTTKPAVIVGLGNPGRKYAHHRHNIGFMVADLLARQAGADWRSARDKTLLCECRIDSDMVLLVKPQTFMNLSGRAVAPLVKRLYIEPGQLIAVHDDMDLVVGKVRLKQGGGDGGHRGIRSIAECIGTKDFVRIRLGIGRPPAGVEPEEFVLSPFAEDEAGEAEELVSLGAEAVRLVLTMGLEDACNKIHAVKPRRCE